MFETAKTVFQQRLKDTLKTDSSRAVIEDLIRLHLFKNAEKNEALLTLVEVYDLLGIDKFTDLIAILDGKTITFPRREDFRDTVQLAICYYYRTVEGKSWKDIKAILGEDELPTIKYGIRMQQFQVFLEYIANRIKMKNGVRDGK
jgi:hypothetical protein